MEKFRCIEEVLIKNGRMEMTEGFGCVQSTSQWAKTLMSTQQWHLERLWSSYSYMKMMSYVSRNMTQFEFQPSMVWFSRNRSLKFRLVKFEFAANLNWLGYSGALW